jgi:hypothetical protein
MVAMIRKYLGAVPRSAGSGSAFGGSVSLGAQRTSRRALSRPPPDRRSARLGIESSLASAARSRLVALMKLNLSCKLYWAVHAT